MGASATLLILGANPDLSLLLALGGAPQQPQQASLLPTPLQQPTSQPPSAADKEKEKAQQKAAKKKEADRKERERRERERREQLIQKLRNQALLGGTAVGISAFTISKWASLSLAATGLWRNLGGPSLLSSLVKAQGFLSSTTVRAIEWDVAASPAAPAGRVVTFKLRGLRPAKLKAAVARAHGLQSAQQVRQLAHWLPAGPGFFEPLHSSASLACLPDPAYVVWSREAPLGAAAIPAFCGAQRASLLGLAEEQEVQLLMHVLRQAALVSRCDAPANGSAAASLGGADNGTAAAAPHGNGSTAPAPRLGGSTECIDGDAAGREGASGSGQAAGAADALAVGASAAVSAEGTGPCRGDAMPSAVLTAEAPLALAGGAAAATQARQAAAGEAWTAAATGRVGEDDSVSGGRKGPPLWQAWVRVRQRWWERSRTPAAVGEQGEEAGAGEEAPGRDGGRDGAVADAAGRDGVVELEDAHIPGIQQGNYAAAVRLFDALLAASAPPLCGAHRAAPRDTACLGDEAAPAAAPTRLYPSEAGEDSGLHLPVLSEDEERALVLMAAAGDPPLLRLFRAFALPQPAVFVRYAQAHAAARAAGANLPPQAA